LLLLSGKKILSNFDNPLPGNEVEHTAKSIAKWTYRNFSQTGFSQIQAARGAKGGKVSGKVRAAKNEDKRAKARLMRSQGMKQVDIAKQLGVSRETVRLWLNIKNAK